MSFSCENSLKRQPLICAMSKGTQNDMYNTNPEKSNRSFPPLTLYMSPRKVNTHTHKHQSIKTTKATGKKTNKQAYIHALGDLPDECWLHWDQRCVWVLSRVSSCGQGPADHQHCGPTPTPPRHFPVPDCALVPRWCRQCSRLTALGFLVVWNGCETAFQADRSDAL